jgi:hypothetical protein
MRATSPDPMNFLDSKGFTAALIWLITFGACYLAGATEGVRTLIPTVLMLGFLLSFREGKS